MLLTEHISKLLDCKIKSLRDRLNHPIDRSKVLKSIVGKKVRTTYPDRNGMKKTFFIGGLSYQPAAFLPAYGKLCGPYNVSVAAHFYVRHRLRLRFPYLVCICEKVKSGNEPRFYPLELVQLVDEDDQNIWPYNMYREIGTSTESSSNTLFTIPEEDDSDFRREISTQTEEDDTEDDW